MWTADRDGDVDADDLAAIKACLSGPAVPLAPDCRLGDLDADGDADQSDFGLFQRCLSGKSIAAFPACAD